MTPNCKTKVITLGEVPRLILVAKSDIVAGSELLYDYGDRLVESYLHCNLKWVLATHISNNHKFNLFRNFFFFMSI